MKLFLILGRLKEVCENINIKKNGIIFPMNKKTIILATDHAGFGYKERVKEILQELNYNIKDMGALKYNAVDDYPDFISKASLLISNHPEKYLGIIFGGSGQGEAIIANRYPNVRAVVYYNHLEEILKLSKEHNNANILSIGARFIKKDDLKKIIQI